MKGEKASELDFLEKQTLILTTEMKDKIKAMVEEVERKVQHCQLLVNCLSAVCQLLVSCLSAVCQLSQSASF